MAGDEHLPPGLTRRLTAMFPGARVVSARHLGTGDEDATGETAKGIGYGKPIRVVLEAGDARHDLVLHTAGADDFGHDRRSDRVAAMLLAWDSFDRVPGHVRAVDVGVVGRDGELVSLAEAGEAYLLSRWADGEPYAAELRRIAETGRATERDVAHARRLAELLAEIHAAPGSHPGGYVRALRDLVGSGEGIAGIADGYASCGEVPGAPLERIAAIEAACLTHRHRHRHRTERLRRTHGDFHPFNILFDGDAPVLLDTSRGSEGDPADDVACLAINYLFFGLEHRARWASGLGVLWRAFFEAYRAARSDEGLFDVIAPFFAWRGLVVASPQWYPHMAAVDRDRILRFVERTLAASRFDPAMGEEAMR
jgi:hypothetical protein